MAAAAVLAACGGGGTDPVAEPPYSVETVRSGFIEPDEVAEDMQVVAEADLASHTMYIPANAIPTCPYIDRSDSVTEPVLMYVEPVGAQTTGKFLVQANDFRRTDVPYIGQAALVFATQAMAEGALQEAAAEHAKCPAEFDVSGAPPEILGSYKVSSRPFEAHGWKGWAQHLVHTYPEHQDDVVYDDQVNVVLQKANAVLLFSYNKVMEIGQVAVGEDEIDELLDEALARLG